MIKTNQILSVGLSLSIGKIREKLWANQQPSQKLYVKSENQQNQHRSSAEKPWGQGCVEIKLLELKHLLDQKNLPNEKPP